MNTSSERLASGIWLVRADGEADLATSPVLEAGLQEALGEPRPRLVLDLSGLTYVSSAGLRVILRARQKALERSGWIRLFGLQRGVLKVLEEAGLSELLPIFPGREEAEGAPEEGP
jgi:anti-sigma B factor antagonist